MFRKGLAAVVLFRKCPKTCGVNFNILFQFQHFYTYSRAYYISNTISIKKNKTGLLVLKHVPKLLLVIKVVSSAAFIFDWI